MRWFLLSLALMIGTAQSQQPQQTPQIPAKKESNSPLKDEEKSETKTNNAKESVVSVPGSHPEISANKSQHNANQGGEEASEFWTIAGRRLKITDSLLVVFTFFLFFATVLLWWSTRRLVKAADNTAQKELRAYVGAKTAAVTFIVQDFSIRTKIKNTGQTPAFHAHLWNELALVEHPIPKGFKFQAAPEKINGPRYVIFPGSGIFFTTQPDNPFTQQEIQDIAAGRKRIYHWGEIRYKDIFENHRHTWFRIYWRAEAGPSFGTWIFDEEGNDAT